MSKRLLNLFLLTAFVLGAFASSLQAAKPWEMLIPFKRVEADPAQSYSLSEEQGPWMILASSFTGPGAEEQARDLVLELRKELNVHAFLHQETYDFSKPVVGLGLDKYGAPKKMRYANASRIREIAVLVGNFQGVNDPKVDKTLEKIRMAHPKCLGSQQGDNTTQSMASLRELYRRLTPDKDKKQRGPMGNAFVTRNPLLPKEMFAAGGLEPFVENMNKGVEFSLLKNPKRFTVQIATFRGASTMKVASISKQGQDLQSKLEVAALNAHKVTMALRQQGIEAYEFHDRYESIVTVGSFDSVGSPRADGKTEIDRQVHHIMNQYGAQRQQIPGQHQVGLVPREIAGVPLDVQPMPVEVPRTSIAAAYSASNRLFR